MAELVIHDDGSPGLRLTGATVIAPNTRSGNPAHEVGSGRFGNTPGGRRRGKVKPVDQAAVASQQRRRDAVVDAARTIVDLSPAGVEAFVRKRWRGDRPITNADVQSFAADARRQRLDDLVDALDHRLRKATQTDPNGVARVSFPRAWVRRTFRDLDASEIAVVLQRLRDREWSEDQVRRYVVRPFRAVVKREVGERAIT